ncbi:MAG: PH domain-containing protein [Acidimicrobiales bacterium]
MAYPKRLLSEGEDLVAEIRPHWSFMLGPMVVVVVAVAAAIASFVIAAVPSVVVYILLGAVVVSIAWLGGRYARWSTTNFVVTSERLVLRSGVLARRGREILLRRVNDLSYRQSILERILGCGSLVIESGGERGAEAVPRLARPFEVQRLINDQVKRQYASSAGSRAHRPELSIPEQLEKLDELCRRGIITTAELTVKRAQLLERW